MNSTESPPTTLSEERLRLRKLAELYEEAHKPTTNWLKEQLQESHFSQYARLNAEEIAVDLLHAAEQMAKHQWQPIEGARKDGSVIWAFNGEQGRMKWSEGDGWGLWIWDDEVLMDVDPSPTQPTHFMTLPPAPEKGGQGESDYAPYCQYCGAKEKQFCKCGPIAKNH